MSVGPNHIWESRGRSPRLTAALMGHALHLYEGGRRVAAIDLFHLAVRRWTWQLLPTAGRLARDWCSEGVGPVNGTTRSGVPYPRKWVSAVEKRRHAARMSVVHRRGV